MANSESIIILDDDLFFGKLICHFLKNQEYSNVELFTDPECCIRNLDSSKNYFFIIDHNLEKSSGFEFLDYLQSINLKFRHVYVSSQEYCHIALKALRNGAIDYIEKDRYTLGKLARTMQLSYKRNDPSIQRRIVLDQFSDSTCVQN